MFEVSYDMFRAQQAPFVASSPLSRGTFFFLTFAAIVMGVGFVFLIVRLPALFGYPAIPTAGLAKSMIIFALGAGCFVAVRLIRDVSAKNLRKQNEEFLRDSYARLHCRDQRFVEANEQGLVFGCNCKSVVWPWAKIVMTGESERGFMIGSITERQIVPSTAFPAEAARTEFRRLLSQKLNENKCLNARAIEFTCSRQDWWHADWLRLKMGGWVRSLLMIFLCALLGFYVVYIALLFDDNAQFLPWWSGVVFVVCLLAALATVRHKPVRPIGLMKMWFAEDAIYAETASSEARIAWNQVTGCVGDKRSLVLILRGAGALLIPQRFIAGPQREYIISLLRTKFGGREKPATVKVEGSHP